MVADQYSTDHHEYLLSAGEAADSIDPVLHAFDEPFSGVTSTYFLTKLISKHVKVALSGDGADELFGSYLSHRLAQPLEVRRRLNRDGEKPSKADVETLKPFHQRLDYLDQLLAIEDEAGRRLSLHLWDDAGKANRHRPFSRARQLRRDAGSSGCLPDCRTADPLNAHSTTTSRPCCRTRSAICRPIVDGALGGSSAALSRSPACRICRHHSDYMKIRAGREKHILKEAVRGLFRTRS